MTTKPLDRTIQIQPSDWRKTPGGYEANFLLYGSVEGKPPEGTCAILQGLRLVDTWPRSPVTLQHIVFNGRLEADPAPGSEGFNDKGELHLSLVGFGTHPLLMPGMLAELILSSAQRPEHPLRIEPIFRPITPAEALTWFQWSREFVSSGVLNVLHPTRTTK